MASRVSIYSQLGSVAIATLRSVASPAATAAGGPLAGAAADIFAAQLAGLTERLGKVDDADRRLRDAIEQQVRASVADLHAIEAVKTQGIEHAAHLVGKYGPNHYSIGKLGLDPEACAQQVLTAARNHDNGWAGGEAYYTVAEAAIRTTYVTVCTALQREGGAQLGMLAGLRAELARESQISAQRSQAATLASIRRERLDWSAEYLRAARAHAGGRGEWSHIGEPMAVTTLRREGVDTTRVEAAVAMAEGHLTVLDVAYNPRFTWFSRIDSLGEPAAEIAVAVLNGALDIAKDSLLTLDDFQWVDDGYFSTLDRPELFAGLTMDQLMQAGSDTTECVRASVARWVLPKAPSDVRVRLEALTVYKVSLEHCLAMVLVGDFVNRESVGYGEAMRDAFNAQSVAVDQEVARRVADAMKYV